MPLSFRVEGSVFICTGDDLKFLRLKARLGAFLGAEQIRVEGKNRFAIPMIAAVAASDAFVAELGSLPQELAEASDVYAKHESARTEAMSGVMEEWIQELESPWLEILDPKQAVAVSAMVTPELLGLCLFDEQGIGKTVTTIAAFDIMKQRGLADSLLVVAPLTMTAEWKKEIERFLPGKYNITLADGSGDERRQKILNPFDVLILNYEAIPQLLVPLTAVLKNKKTVLAVDESFSVKNKDAIRSVAVRDLRNYCVRGFVMCGTPAPNSPVDVIHQFDIADSGYTFAGFTPPKSLEESKEAITERMEDRGAYVRRLKEEALPNLPEKNFHVVFVVLSGRQQSLYEDARNKLELSLRGMDNAIFKRTLTSYFQQRSVLLQICACPESIDPNYADTSAKMRALDEVVDAVVEKAGKKLIIWSFYRAGLRSAMGRYSKYSPVLLDGSTTAKQRAIDVDRFQNDDSVRICVANPAAAGAGITLHAASDAAYLSFSNQAAHFLQSLDRIHRRGQKAKSTDYHVIVCRDTIEESEVQRLRAKEVRQHELLGDAVKWPNTLDEALAEITKKHE